MNRKAGLQRYAKRVSQADRVFPCPACRASLHPKDYEGHCSRHHRLDSKIQCVWCAGETAWPRGKKYENADHLLACFKKFLDDRSGEGGSTVDGMDRYRREVNRAAQIFRCPDCEAAMRPREWEGHCRRSHRLDPKTQCAWCRGAQSWPIGEKQRHADHLILCLKRFLFRLDAPPASSSEDAILPFDVTPLCAPLTFWGRRRWTDLPDRAYAPVWPLAPWDDPSNGLTFAGPPSLQWAVSYVRYFVAHHRDIEVFHGMIKAVIYANFLRAMDADGGCTRTLPFSCWCDGGKEPRAFYRQHRHLIFVAPRGHFVRNVWSRIERPRRDLPRKNFSCLCYKRIETPLHLVNAMGYASRRRSKCDATFDTQAKTSRQNHFYIACPLPRAYKRVLATQWDGGLLQLVRQRMANLDPKRLVAGCRFLSGRWRIRVRDVPGLGPPHLALPVARSFRPTASCETRHFICLSRGRRLYFEGVEGEGGCEERVGVFAVVGSELVVPRPKHQTFLTDWQVLLTPIRQELEAKTRQLEASEREWEAKVRVLEAKVRALEAKEDDEEALKEGLLVD